MRILAIETSCDETALALLECSGSAEHPTVTTLSHALYSQIKEHAPYGGVFPALAKREHAKNIVPLFLECIKKAQDSKSMAQSGADSGFFAHEQQKPERRSESHTSVSPLFNLETIETILQHEGPLFGFFLEHIVPMEKPTIDMIAVTNGPGLEPALWVGVNFAKALSYLWDIPLVPTNHMEGHIASVLVEETKDVRMEGNNSNYILTSLHPSIQYPAIALLASGGHTELVRINAPLNYERIGQTRDDAVGEAFDKAARLLGLPYPGGPQISKLAAQFRNKLQAPNSKYQKNLKTQKFETGITFPRPMINSDDFDFSYSGLKTALLYKVQELGEITDELKEVLAYEFEEAAIDVLISKTKKALEAHGATTLIVGGGVIASAYLRERLTTLAEEAGVTLMLPTRELSTDNAVMIGAAAYLHIANGEQFKSFSIEQTVEADGTLRL